MPQSMDFGSAGKLHRKQKNGTVWLKEFLPKQFPTARITPPGYGSGIAFSCAVTGISDVAKTLLERLRGERKRE